MSADLVPGAIELRPDGLLLRWPDGAAMLRAADLRAACRCAGCRAALLSGHPQGLDQGVRLRGAAPVGLYALQLIFSDGHDRGIFPWALLRGLSPPRAV